VQNLIKINSAVAALRMHEKTGLGVGFLLAFFATHTGHIFRAVLTLNG